MTRQLHSQDEDRPRACIGPCGVRGYRGVRCRTCGKLISFFVGDPRKAACWDCSHGQPGPILDRRP